MRTYLLLLLVAAVVTYLLVPAMYALAVRLGGRMHDVRDRDMHKQATPRLGGVAMLGGVLAAMLVANQLPFLDPVMAGTAPWAVLVAGAMVCLVGAIDDVWNLDPLTRLAAQCLAGLLLAWQGVQLVSLPVLGVTVGSGGFLLILSVFAVVATINAINVIDGLDGLVAGVMAITGSAFFLYAYALTREANRSDYSSLAAALAAITLGVCLGFLPHNANPARIFMGDSGAYLIGLLMASAVIVVTGQVDPGLVSQARLVPAFGPVLFATVLLFIPSLDLFLAVVRRASAGRSITEADRGHLHHQLIDRLRHSHRSAVLTMYCWAALVGYGAVAWSFLPLPWAVTLVTAGSLFTVSCTVWPRCWPWLKTRLGLAVQEEG